MHRAMAGNRNRLGALGDGAGVRVGMLEGGAVNVEPASMWVAEAITWAAIGIVALTASGAILWVATVAYGAVSAASS